MMYKGIRVRILMKFVSVLCASHALASQEPAGRFRLVTPDRARHDPEPHSVVGMPPELDDLVAIFAPMIPSRCSWVGPVNDGPVLSGGITFQVRQPAHFALLSAHLNAHAPRTSGGNSAGMHRAEGGGEDALIRAVLAQVEGMSELAAQWYARADEHYQRRLMQTLIVAGYSLSQAQRYEDSILILALALQLNTHPAAAQDALELLGVSLQQSHNVQCAEEAHSHALAKSPNRPIPQLNIGLLKLHSARETAAQAHLER
jgi:hypothetical protein